MLRNLKRENGFLKKILIHRKTTLMKVFLFPYVLVICFHSAPYRFSWLWLLIYEAT